MAQPNEHSPGCVCALCNQSGKPIVYTPSQESRLIGLHFGENDSGENIGWVNYDIAEIVLRALDAMDVAVLAMEQIVTGEKLVKGLDVGDFYRALAGVLAVNNGEGYMSEGGNIPGIQSEIHDVRLIIRRAMMIAPVPPEDGAEVQETSQ